MQISHLCHILVFWVSWFGASFAHQNVQFGQQQPQHQHGHQQPPQQQVGGGSPPHAHHQGNMFDKAQVQDREHIKEHLEGVIQQPDTSKMSEQELQFHYFKMHDNDNNNKLDGSELIKSLIHWHVAEGSNPNSGVEHKIFDEAELQTLIDPILTSDDLNADGFIDYAEFAAAQARMAAKQPQQQQQHQQQQLQHQQQQQQQHQQQHHR